MNTTTCLKDKILSFRMGKDWYNSKISIGASLAFIAIIGTTAVMLSLEENSPSLTTEEINKLEQEQNRYAVRSAFTSGDMVFLKDWCTDNKGLWTQAESVVRGECAFETRTQHTLAQEILEDVSKPKVTGKSAEDICLFLGMKCPQYASFDGYYQIDTGTTIVSYVYGQTVYRFDVTDENHITYRVGDSEASYNLSDDSALGDQYHISVRAGYDYYQLGDRIVIGGIVRDNHHILSKAVFEHPVILQIIKDDVLVEVAQLKIGEDGEFQYVINTDGGAWQSGQYQVKTTFDTYTATTTFDMDKESRNLLGK